VRFTTTLAPLTIVAVTLAACGVSKDRSLEGVELPAASEGVEVDPDTHSDAPVGTVTPPPVTPTGTIARADHLIPGFVTISGWVDDGIGTDSIEVTAWLDLEPVVTVPATETWSRSTNEAPGVRFAVDLPVPAGPHVVCVTAEPDATPLDCVQLAEQPTVEEIGDGTVLLTAVTPDPFGSVMVRGVVADFDDVVATTIDVDIGGDPTGSTPVTNQAFRFRIDGLATGMYAVCAAPAGITVRERMTEPAAADGCGSIVIGELHVGTTGLTSSIEAVAPPADHPLYLMERDGGVSVGLTDGSTIWFFGDSMERRTDGSLRYFVNNTAAWTSADEPTLTRDAVSTDREPFLFAEAPPGTCTTSTFPDAALWPESAVAIPQDDGTDRVVVVMSKVCLGATWLDIDLRGYVVAEFTYDPDDPPVDRPVRGVVTQADLAPADAGYGRALLVEDDGYLYGYQCGLFPDSWGPCRVARVLVGDITDAAAWRYWTGDDWTDPTNWVPDRSAAAPMQVPDVNADALPVASFGVVHDKNHEAHLMVYSPWPGFCGELDVRVADTPVGPWTGPIPITLPDCTEDIAGLEQSCYAGTPQMQLCDDSEIAGGFFDMMTDLGVGRYLTFVTPFVITRPQT
jgi:hypothetical protein